MFRPPFLARVAAGAAVYALEETRRLPAAAVKFPVTAVSQLLQTSMHMQQFVTSLAIKGDGVFERLGAGPDEQPEWATFDEDVDDTAAGASAERTTARPAEHSGFDRFEVDPAEVEAALAETLAGLQALDDNGGTTATDNRGDDDSATTDNGDTFGTDTAERRAAPAAEPAPMAETAVAAAGVIEPEVAARYGYSEMTLAQLRARLRMLSVDDLRALLEYEEQTLVRAPFVTMLTNRIATVRAQ